MIDLDLGIANKIGYKLSSEFNKKIEIEEFDFDGVTTIIAFVDNKVLEEANDYGHYYERVFEMGKDFIKVRFFEDSIKDIERIFYRLIDLLEPYFDEDFFDEIKDNILRRFDV